MKTFRTRSVPVKVILHHCCYYCSLSVWKDSRCLYYFFHRQCIEWLELNFSSVQREHRCIWQNFRSHQNIFIVTFPFVSTKDINWSIMANNWITSICWMCTQRFPRPVESAFITVRLLGTWHPHPHPQWHTHTPIVPVGVYAFKQLL